MASIVAVEFVLATVGAAVVFEAARRRFDAWAVRRAEEISKRKEAKALAKKEFEKKYAQIKQNLTIGAVATGVTLVAVAYLRYRGSQASAARTGAILKPY